MEEEEGENILDEKEIANLKPRSYFLEILNSIKYDEIKTKKEHMKYLLLSLLVKQPPLRTNFYSSAKIITNTRGMNDHDNYVQLIYAGRPRVYYIVNHG